MVYSCLCKDLISIKSQTTASALETDQNCFAGNIKIPSGWTEPSGSIQTKWLQPGKRAKMKAGAESRKPGVLGSAGPKTLVATALILECMEPSRSHPARAWKQTPVVLW